MMSWAKLPPLMQRTFRDDLKWAAAVLAGAVIGWLVFAAGDLSLLLGAVMGAVLTIVVLSVIRPLVRRGKADHGRYLASAPARSKCNSAASCATASWPATSRFPSGCGSGRRSR